MRPLLLSATIAVNLLAADPEAEWPQFRGSNASGVAAEDADPPVVFGASSKRARWKTALPPGHSSPVVSANRVFLTSFDPDSKKLELFCIAANTGAILWRRAAPAVEALEEAHVVSNPATASPAVDGERVYAYFSSYGLMAFNYAGDSQWMLPLPMPKTHHGSGASPVLAGDLLILNHDAMREGYLLAVARRTGKEAWKQVYPAQPGRVESYSTPVVFNNQVILHRSGVIEAYDVPTGEKRWTTPASTSGASTPTVNSDTIYISTWNNLGEDDQRPALPDFAALVERYDKNGDGLVSETEFPADLKYTARPELDAVPNSQNFAAFRNLDRNKDGVLQESEWEAFRSRVGTMAQDHGLLALRPKGGGATVLWRENTAIPEVPSPLLYKGRLFLIRNGGIATCLDGATGKVIYRGRVGSPGAYFASPVAAAGRVYLASSEGVVTVLSAGGSQMDVLARNELGQDIVATPAIVKNTIYVRTLRTLYAFGEQ